jgi:Mrp family chromosome partitioning ATPase
MQARYDVVIFDGPPLSTASDSILLAKQTAVVMVFAPSICDATRLENAVLQLRKSDGKVVGLFVNAVETDAAAETEAPALAESA